MAKIQNYEVCVNADELSNAEILLTTALLIRGYYCSASRVYISFIGSNMKETAVATVSTSGHKHTFTGTKITNLTGTAAATSTTAVSVAAGDHTHAVTTTTGNTGSSTDN